MTEPRIPFADEFSSWIKAWEAFASNVGFLDLASQALDPRRWLGIGWMSMEGPLGTIAGLPRFALPTLDRKLMALLGGWLLLAERNAQHSVMVMRAWSEAYAELFAELNRDAAEGKAVHAGRELLDRFVTVLNHKMQVIQRSEDFLASQRKLLEALLSSRTRERELIELVANAFDLPTRTEMDDAHRSVHDLKREMRALRRQLEDLKGPAAGAARTVASGPRAADRQRGASRTKGDENGSAHPA